MVCVPCFIIPVLLYIWHKFFQPLLLRYWNPWEKKDADGNVIKAGPEFPFQCKGDSCPFPVKRNKALPEGNDTSDATEARTATDSQATSEQQTTGTTDSKKVN